jgi:hypothetical protein
MDDPPSVGLGSELPCAFVELTGSRQDAMLASNEQEISKRQDRTGE